METMVEQFQRNKYFHKDEQYSLQIQDQDTSVNRDKIVLICKHC